MNRPIHHPIRASLCPNAHVGVIALDLGLFGGFRVPFARDLGIVHPGGVAYAFGMSRGDEALIVDALAQ